MQSVAWASAQALANGSADLECEEDETTPPGTASDPVDLTVEDCGGTAASDDRLPAKGSLEAGSQPNGCHRQMPARGAAASRVIPQKRKRAGQQDDSDGRHYDTRVVANLAWTVASQSTSTPSIRQCCRAFQITANKGRNKLKGWGARAIV